MNDKIHWKWHDIKYAPKDGQPILLMQGRNRICKIGRWSEKYNHWSTGYGPFSYLEGVTHWGNLECLTDCFRQQLQQRDNQ